MSALLTQMSGYVSLFMSHLRPTIFLDMRAFYDEVFYTKTSNYRQSVQKVQCLNNPEKKKRGCFSERVQSDNLSKWTNHLISRLDV